ncbi:unnamed protein product [Arctia plantaginis]|uniref:Uncharacterized protein n=1 Tax=Arctia plantaginis TaxID=874455 RepID=A0A8S1BIS7_ARCPL|nr:unnamed protein product [Arctia plantaginis]CAB3259948.1 unnamed protein product [Arctia plantaginis]
MKLRTKRNTGCKVSDKKRHWDRGAGVSRERGGDGLRGERREVNAPHMARRVPSAGGECRAAARRRAGRTAIAGANENLK